MGGCLGGRVGKRLPRECDRGRGGQSCVHSTWRSGSRSITRACRCIAVPQANHVDDVYIRSCRDGKYGVAKHLLLSSAV